MKDPGQDRTRKGKHAAGSNTCGGPRHNESNKNTEEYCHCNTSDSKQKRMNFVFVKTPAGCCRSTVQPTEPSQWPFPGHSSPRTKSRDVGATCLDVGAARELIERHQSTFKEMRIVNIQLIYI